MKHKTEIEIELNETFRYSRRGESFGPICPQCKLPVEMSTPEVAPVLPGSAERETHGFVELDENDHGEIDGVLACLNSLINFNKK